MIDYLASEFPNQTLETSPQQEGHNISEYFQPGHHSTDAAAKKPKGVFYFPPDAFI